MFSISENLEIPKLGKLLKVVYNGIKRTDGSFIRCTS